VLVSRHRELSLPLMGSAPPWVCMCSGRGLSGSHVRGSSPFPTRSLRFDRAPSAARFHERFDSQAENSFSVRRTVQSLPSRLRPRGPQVCSPTEFSSSPPPASLRPAPHRTRKPDTVNRHCWRLPWGSRSLFATSPVGVHARGFPAPPAFPSAAFRTLSTAFSANRLAGLFHPAATSRVPPSRVSTRMQLRRLFDGALPSRRCRLDAADVATGATPHRPALRA
jgi:hypothetical protein